MDTKSRGAKPGDTGVQWTDANKFLESVCEDMELGTLIHGENFSLFEAMSALEIMDPKMDAGMAISGVRSLEEAIAGGAAPITLSHLELVDIMDHLLACEATWHNGSSLAQTVFTCLYLLDVERSAPNALLHAHCRAVRATCNLVRTLVCKADAREEEDFVTASVGLPLEGDTDSKSLAGLAAAEEAVARQLKAARGAAAAAATKKPTQGQGNGAAEHGNLQSDETLCRALMCRIRFRKSLYHALANMDKPQGRGLDLAKKHLASALAELAIMRTTVISQSSNQTSPPGTVSSPISAGDLQDPTPTPSIPPSTAPSSSPTSLEPITSASRRPTSAASSSPGAAREPPPTPSSEASGCSPSSNADPSDRATAVPSPDLAESSPPQPPATSPAPPATGPQPNGNASAEESGSAAPSSSKTGVATTASGRRPKGFDECVNRRLLSPTPPRPIQIFSWLEALASFEKLLQDLQAVCAAPLTGSLREVQRYLLALQDRRLGPVARCRVQQLVLQDGKVFGRELLPASLFKELQLPVDGDLPKEALLMAFVSKAGRAELRLLRALCGNLSRQRRELAKLLPDWDDLVHEGEKAATSAAFKTFVESTYPKGWWPSSLLVSWSAEQACRTIRHFLLLGFETELYGPSEYCYVYWYLDHVLATLLHNAEARERNWAERQQLQDAGPGPGHGKDKKGKRKKVPGGNTQSPAIHFQGSADLAMTQCLADLCKALVRMLVALKADGKLRYHETEYNLEQERFEQRFEVLKRVHIPEPMPYTAFRDGTNIAGLAVAEVYQMAFEFFQRTGSQVAGVTERLASDGEVAQVTREQQLKEIQQMGQVAMRNCLALQVAHRAGPGPTLKVSFDFSIHPCFPVAVLKRS